MPWFSAITSALHAMPMNTMPMPRSTRLRAQNAEDQHVRRDEQPEARRRASAPAGCVTNSSDDLDREAERTAASPSAIRTSSSRVYEPAGDERDERARRRRRSRSTSTRRNAYANTIPRSMADEVLYEVDARRRPRHDQPARAPQRDVVRRDARVCATRWRARAPTTTVRVVVLTGAGDKAFCAGADLGGGGHRRRAAPPRTTGAGCSPTCSATCGRSASRSSPACAATRSPAASGSRARAT